MIRYIIEIDDTDDGIGVSEIVTILQRVTHEIARDNSTNSAVLCEHWTKWREEEGPDTK